MRKTYSEHIQLNIVLRYKASFDYGFIGDAYVFQLKWSFPITSLTRRILEDLTK
jgi:hypothetical protein